MIRFAIRSRGEFEGALIGGAGVPRLAVGDDHTLERKLK